MTTTGFLPSISYGPSVLGVSSFEIKRMRREMCASALVHRAGRCPYTVSSIVYNRKDPLIAVGLSQLKTWWGAWISSDDFRRRIQRAWARIQARIRNAPSNRRWRRTHGPIGGIIATLTDHGWEAASADRWTSPGGTAFNLSDPALLSDPSPLFSHFEATLWHDFWLAADNGYCGTGLAGGCDMTVLRRQWNTLHESDTQAAGMLLNAVAGGNWVRARKHAARLVEDALCARCGLADETEAHRLWQCEHNNSLDLPPMPPAISTYGDAESCPALWIRGLVPGQFLHHFPVPEETPLFGCKEAATDDVITPRQGEYLLVGFGDASGGRYATDARYRRVGTAAIIVDFPGNDWTDIEDLSVQQFIDTTSPTSLCTEQEPTSSPIEPLSLRLHEAFCTRHSPCARVGCRRCRGRRKRRREASSGLSFSHSLTHVAPFCISPTTWGSLRVFGKNVISSPLHFWRSFGLGSVFSWPKEAPTWRFAMLAATPRPMTWLRDARSFRSCWATAWPTRWRACQQTLRSATKDRCFLTHI